MSQIECNRLRCCLLNGVKEKKKSRLFKVVQLPLLAHSDWGNPTTLLKKGILLLSETLLGFPNGSETPKKVFKWLGNPKRVSDSNKIPFFYSVT